MSEQRVPLRQQRDLSQIIGDAVSLYTQNLWPLFGIAAVVIPLGIASAALQTAIDDQLVEGLVLLAIAIPQAVVSLLAAAAVIAALAAMDAGRPAEFSPAYDAAFERFWTLLGAVLRVGIVVLLLAITIIGIPFAIYHAVRWAFVQQAVILDRTSARAALSYSADAVRGSWWRTFGIGIVIGIIGAVPSGIIAGLFVLAPPLVSGTVNAVVSAVVLPFSVTATTLLYLDLKTRRESVAAGP